MTDEGVNLPLPDLFLEWRDLDYWIELVGAGVAQRTIPICDWGGCTFSAVDCSTPEGNMLLFVDGVERVDQEVSFARWMEDWGNGIAVGAHDYARVKRRDKWLPKISD